MRNGESSVAKSPRARRPAFVQDPEAGKEDGTMRSSISIYVLAGFLIAASAPLAAAHCCHDSSMLGVQHQSQLRSGLHGMGEGLTDDAIEAEPPTIDDSLDNRGTANQGIGGFGQMHGNSIGNYGAGSLGQTGPGGLGAMKNGGLGNQPVRIH